MPSSEEEEGEDRIEGGGEEEVVRKEVEPSPGRVAPGREGADRVPPKTLRGRRSMAVLA
jgi:hypothetical protein